jgi:hypothetical protein
MDIKAIKTTAIKALSIFKKKTIINAIGIYYISIFKRCIPMYEKIILNFDESIIEDVLKIINKHKETLSQIAMNMSNKEKWEKVCIKIIEEFSHDIDIESLKTDLENLEKSDFRKRINTEIDKNKEHVLITAEKIKKDAIKLNKIINMVSK